jgi:hypothetical protein
VALGPLDNSFGQSLRGPAMALAFLAFSDVYEDATYLTFDRMTMFLVNEQHQYHHLFLFDKTCEMVSIRLCAFVVVIVKIWLGKSSVLYIGLVDSSQRHAFLLSVSFLSYLAYSPATNFTQAKCTTRTSVSNRSHALLLPPLAPDNAHFIHIMLNNRCPVSVTPVPV